MCMQARDQDAFLPNYYSALRVRRHADPALFRAAFKERSLQLHPDKNPAPDAQDQFNRLKEAYDVCSSCNSDDAIAGDLTFLTVPQVLSDPTQRHVYNFFGEEGLRNDPRVDRLQLVIDIAFSHMVWLALAIAVTFRLPTDNGRTFACAAVALSLAIEVAVRLYEQQLPVWWPFSITEHELVIWVRKLLPAVLLSCRVLGLHLFADSHAAVVVLAHFVQEHHKVTCLLQALAQHVILLLYISCGDIAYVLLLRCVSLSSCALVNFPTTIFRQQEVCFINCRCICTCSIAATGTQRKRL